MNNKSISIYGAGPSGLFAASLLLEKGFQVTLYEQNKALAKKFLVAGSSGLNLTHSLEIDQFASKYYERRDLFLKLLNEFGPMHLRDWAKSLGVETFKGSSGRVFPKELSAGQMLNNWKKHLNSFSNFKLITQAKFIGFSNSDNPLVKINDKTIENNNDYHIFALGGTSWKNTGSTGEWLDVFKQKNIKVHEPRPINCGFNISWSDHLKNKLNNSHLKNIKLSIDKQSAVGDINITDYGIESGVVYELSKYIRDSLENNESTKIKVDLLPHLKEEEITIRFLRPKGKNSNSNYLRKVLKLNSTSVQLLNEYLKGKTEKVFTNPKILKTLEFEIISTRPIDEAISTSGGVCIDQLNEYFQHKQFPQLFFIGEMLDWEAPTGGFLLQGCFSTAFKVSQFF